MQLNSFAVIQVQTARAGLRASGAERAAPLRAPTADGKLRVGILSGDLFDHVVARFLEAPLRCKKNMHISCYSVRAYQDETTTVLKGLTDCWVDAAAMDTEQLVNRIRQDKIQVTPSQCDQLRESGLSATRKVHSLSRANRSSSSSRENIDL